MTCDEVKHQAMRHNPILRRLHSVHVKTWPLIGVLFTCRGCLSSFVVRQ